MSKIFGIGFHKTGTTSLGTALSVLGYNSCFGANGLRAELGELTMMQCLFKKEYQKIFKYAEQYDAFNDLPWFALYETLDQQYPNSKFILTIRDEQDWLNSAKKYFKNTVSPFRLWLYGQPNPNDFEDIYLQRYKQHNKAVMNYFSNRNDFLILDINATNKWELICDFLETNIPLVEFPHSNKKLK